MGKLRKKSGNHAVEASNGSTTKSVASSITSVKSSSPIALRTKAPSSTAIGVSQASVEGLVLVPGEDSHSISGKAGAR